MNFSQESIASRLIRVNQLLLGKSNLNFPTKHLAHRDALLDTLFALYDECSADYLRKDKLISTFVEKFRSMVGELRILRVGLKDFEQKQIIGRGHFGEVQVVREKATGDVYAMKILRKQETLSQKNMAFFEEERDIMAKTSSPWLTKLQYAFQDTQNLYLVMEFHSGGDMLSLLERYDNSLPEDMCQFYLAELVLAIHSLHSMGYVHRDIKPDNILIDRTGHIKLADFGSASKLNNKKMVTSSMPVGTPDYVAPEVLTIMDCGSTSLKDYGTECDWWSLGIVAYEMTFGVTPFASDTVIVTYSNIMNFKDKLKFPTDLPDLSTTLTDLIKGLLSVAAKRLGYDELVEHSFFMDVDWNNIRNTAPPFVPTVMSIDDTSNFDDFEPENRPYLAEFESRKGFKGKDLPFVGFTYTSPFENLIGRFSIDTSCSASPLCSTEQDSITHRKSTRRSDANFAELQDNLQSQISKRDKALDEKDKNLEIVKKEKALSDQLVVELQAEVKHIKELLFYEREHRLITEKKATEVVRSLKCKQRQDELRLKARSLEYQEATEAFESADDHLQAMSNRLEEMVREKVTLLDELCDVKHALIDYQHRLAEFQHQVGSSGTSEVSTTDSSSIQTQGTSSWITTESTADSSVCNCRSKIDKLLPDSLVSKLEKKNAELEHELDNIMSQKQVAETEVNVLKTTIGKLEQQMKLLEKDDSASQDEEATQDFQAYEITIKDKDTAIADIQKQLYSEKDKNVELQSKLQEVENILQALRDEIKGTECIEDLEVNSPLKKRLSINSVKSKFEKLAREDQENENPILTEKNMKNKRGSIEKLLLTSDLKQENDYLKSRVEVLTAEITQFKESESNFSKVKELQKLIKEKDDALSEIKLDLRVATRKEQQNDSMVVSLRERNKELREQIKSVETSLSSKTKVEEDLRDKVAILEKEVAEFKQEIADKENTYKVEKAKCEERIQTLRDACENSKDINHQFAKSQGQYEEVSKQNSNLQKECEEKETKLHATMQENKTLKTDLIKKQNECSRLDRLTTVLKKSILDLESDLEEFQQEIDSREKKIAVMTDEIDNFKKEVCKLQNQLQNDGSSLKREEMKKVELVKHVSELTTELDNQHSLHETEVQSLTQSLNFCQKELEEAIVKLDFAEREAKVHCERAKILESQLYMIKEEASNHITNIMSLKSSNLKLTQSLSEAIDNQKHQQVKMDNLATEYESETAKHMYDKVKMQATISQQIKLIDFLQMKTENVEKKKKTNISRLFGKKEIPTPILSNRDLNRDLEKERSRCRRLRDQLSQSRAEKVALQREMSSVSKLSDVDVPNSPKSRAMHTVIASSPSCKSGGNDSPLLVSRELINQIPKPPGMKHKIPHRFSAQFACHIGTKCCACLDSIHFGRNAVKCHECAVICHPKCAPSLPSTCGLPLGFMDHFRSIIDEGVSEDTSIESSASSEGWIKVPKSNKQGWDRRYLRLIDNILYVYESSDIDDNEKALGIYDFKSEECNMVVTSAVSATELPYAASSDLPYVLKVEALPNTTCWPQRCLYIMALNFDDKQMWVSVLEETAEKYHIEDENVKKTKLITRNVVTLTGADVIEPFCSTIFDGKVLLGAAQGLYALEASKGVRPLEQKLESPLFIYQMECLEHIGVVVLIHGQERHLSTADMNSFQAVLHGKTTNLRLNPVEREDSCHLFTVEKKTSTPYLCVATADLVMLRQWAPQSKEFQTKKVIHVNDPCSCILFTEETIIFGTDAFYELHIETEDLKRFLDPTDSSLAGLIYGASQYRSFPVAIFQVSQGKDLEYLLCFHEMGVFVNGEGKRTRADDMKWSKLPLSFAFQSPYLFIMHFLAVEVVEIPPEESAEPVLCGWAKMRSPQLMGHFISPHTLLVSSLQGTELKIVEIDGSSIGRSYWSIEEESVSLAPTDCTESNKGSVTEAESLDFSFNTSMDKSDSEEQCHSTSAESASGI